MPEIPSLVADTSSSSNNRRKRSNTASSITSTVSTSESSLTMISSDSNNNVDNGNEESTERSPQPLRKFHNGTTLSKKFLDPATGETRTYQGTIAEFEYCKDSQKWMYLIFYPEDGDWEHMTPQQVAAHSAAGDLVSGGANSLLEDDRQLVPNSVMGEDNAMEVEEDYNPVKEGSSINIEKKLITVNGDSNVEMDESSALLVADATATAAALNAEMSMMMDSDAIIDEEVIAALNDPSILLQLPQTNSPAPPPSSSPVPMTSDWLGMPGFTSQYPYQIDDYGLGVPSPLQGDAQYNTNITSSSLFVSDSAPDIPSESSSHTDQDLLTYSVPNPIIAATSTDIIPEIGFDGSISEMAAISTTLMDKDPEKMVIKTKKTPKKSKKAGTTNTGKSLPSEVVAYLRAWMMSPEHIEHPYPTAEEKQKIMADTGIEMKQLSNWFMNNRKRYWKPRVEAQQQHQASQQVLNESEQHQAIQETV